MNFNERLLQGYDLGKKVSQLHGHTQLDLLRKGQVVERIEKANTITGWIGDALSAGNFFNQIASEKIYPLSQWFGGCYLTDATNDATLAMIAGGSNIVAQAGNAGYSGMNPKMGTFNAIESGSGVDTNGKCFIRNIWDWGTSAGNCQPNQYIKSVCLTRGELGYVDVNSTTTPYDMNAFNPMICSSNFSYSPFHVMNPATGKVYFVAYTSGDTKIVVTERFTNTNKIHLIGGVMGDITSTNHEVPISAAIPSFSRERASVNLDVANGILHLYTWVTSGSGSSQVTTLYDYAIDTSDFESTVTATTLTIQGCHFISGYYDFIRGNVILNDWNGHIWAMAVVDGVTEFIRVTTSNLDVDEYPVILSANGEWWRDNSAPFLLLNNGDWIKYSGNQNRSPMIAWYYHNDEITYMRSSWNRNLNQYSAVDLGGVFLESYSYENHCRLVAGYPYVSTVNNLASGSEVRKTSDLSMKLTYTITEE